MSGDLRCDCGSSGPIAVAPGTDPEPATMSAADYLAAQAVARKKPVQREWAEQKADSAFLSRALPHDAFFTAIDHARKMSAQAGKQRKDRGIKSGIPDWLIVWFGITLWIERKAGSGLSTNQRTTRDRLVQNGHRWALARSTEEVEQACRDAGIPLRATLGEIRDRIEDQRGRLPAKKKRAPREARKDATHRPSVVNAVRSRVMF